MRLLAICAKGELTVGELTEVLGQSQPRISRHLKLMCEAGLLDRFKEGTSVFYRMADERRSLVRTIISMIPDNDSIITRDRERLEAIKIARREQAAKYFRKNAQAWDRIRSLHVDEREVERTLMQAWPDSKVWDFLDIGTGTGRILQLFGPLVERGVGIDLSHDMLAYARANLDEVGLPNCQVRHGNMYRLAIDGASFDAVTVHQVLHYAEEPEKVIFEAARVLRLHGRLVIVDFAPHRLEQLRTEHAHRRLGFADDDVIHWCCEAGLQMATVRTLAGEPLTVKIWVAIKLDRVPAETATGAAENVQREVST